MWGAGIFRLVVMGEIKKGKSSFINAMLGEENLVPVSSDVATSTIYKIRYGREKGYKVHFTKESGKETISITSADLVLFGTEDGNPGNGKQVKFIEVIHPSPILQSGIVIIDTPGLGGLFKGHKQITYEYVPRADAVFFVTDSVDSPIGALELEYINDVRAITPHLYFVQTKCSAVDEDARLARKRNNLNILSDCLRITPENIPYFLLDSKSRFRAERKKDISKLNLSGFPQLMAFIAQNLQGSQRRILAERALRSAMPIVQTVTEIINSRQEVLKAQTDEEKRKLSAKLQDAQEKLRIWQEQEQPRILSNLQSGLQKIRLNALEVCNQCRPNGEIQAEFEQALHACSDINELRTCLQEIEKNLPEYASRVTHNTSSQIKDEATRLLSELIPKSNSTELSLIRNNDCGRGLNMDTLERMMTDMNSGNLFEDVRTFLYGGMAGGMLASVVGGIIGSVIPVLGTVIGSTLGMIYAGLWGGCAASAIKEQQELKAAKHQASGAISHAMSSFYTKLQMTVENLMIEINSRTTQAIQNAIRQRKTELVKQLEDLRSGNRNEATALKEKQDALNKDKVELAAILKVVNSWNTSIKIG